MNLPQSHPAHGDLPSGSIVTPITVVRSRKIGAVALGIIVAVLVGVPGLAEILPTKGKFRGIYHVNRAGVGSLQFFILSQSLKDRMAPYENKYIEMEVLQAQQSSNPGPVLVDQVGNVTRLPDPPLELRLKAVSSNSGAAGVFDLVCSVVNRDSKDVIFNGDSLQVGVRSYPKEAGVGLPGFSNSGYNARQLGFGGSLSPVHNFLSPMEPGQATHFYTHRIVLRPGEEAIFVVHDMRQEPGEYELAAIAGLRSGDDEQIPLMAALPIDLPLAHNIPKPVQPLEVKSHAAHDEEWLMVEGSISDPSATGVSLFALSDGRHGILPGLVQIYAASGDLLQTDLDWFEPSGSWRKSSLGREGVSFKFRVRQKDLFSRTDVAKIGFWTVTSRGLERLTLADHLTPSARPALPPWGALVRGCRMRIATPRTIFMAGEKIRFFVQAESDGSKADLLWVNGGKFQSRVVATVDGRKAKIERGGVSEEISNKFPFQRDVGLVLIENLAPGKHMLQFSVQGDSGTYTDLRGEGFRQLDGTLVSNVVEFEVRHEK